MSIKRLNILGVYVSAINMEEALADIQLVLESDQLAYITVANVHSVMTSYYDPILREIHNRAWLTTPDGMPLVWLCWRYGFGNAARVYGPDLLLAVCERFPQQSHFFYGGEAGVAEQLVERLKVSFPNLKLAGVYSPPFRALTPHEDAAIVEQINASGAQIVWVGLGNPKQEFWMAEYRAKLTAPLLIGVGAAFDFHSGAKRQAPRWMMNLGLEWFFRLTMEPRRLWKRYLFNNPLFIYLILKEMILGRIGVSSE